MWYWWLLAGVMFSCMLIITAGIAGLFHRPDFDLDESEEFSGVINVKKNNKDQHNIDVANRVQNHPGDSGA